MAATGNIRPCASHRSAVQPMDHLNPAPLPSSMSHCMLSSQSSAARFRRVAPSILVPNNPVVQLCRHSIATWLRHRYHRWTAMTSRSNNSRAATVASAVIYKETTFYDRFFFPFHKRSALKETYSDSVKQCSHSRYELQEAEATKQPFLKPQCDATQTCC